MRITYLIFGAAIIAVNFSMIRAGVLPFAVSSEKTTAKPITAGATTGRPRGSSTFIWLGGYGGK